MDMLLIAGMWLDGTVWEDVLPGLAERGVRGVPVTLPGQGDGDARATYEDQVAAVVAALDASDADQVVVVGHSAASTLAWTAADARLDRVAGVVLIGGVPATEGSAYFDYFEPVDGWLPFPGWEPFEGPDIADLDEAARRDLAARTVAVPQTVTSGVVRYGDPRRGDLPVVLLCPEFSPEEALEWIGSGDVPELEQAGALSLVDLDSGHWPMVSRPGELAAVLAEVGAAMRGVPAV
ncbi:alpha/beta fold hydrolase [Nocardioides campestrisoli]|uniref:alpha/beta fold hydrolase n=1 Tax=Nocardioides campestrisoli TaxID=2736757 RepID=UPI0015E6548A|nr:alpha/beta hydrolase [Nocardioides campestrisoli]